MIQTILAVILGKFIFFLTRQLKVGGGSAAPGLWALKIDPQLLSHLAPQIPQNIVITGTNGKTTTARLLDHLVKTQNLKIVRNSTGSNLERGIASALIEKSNLFGQIKNVDLGIWETDEAAFNSVVPKLKPQIMVFLNAFRDQLDRYGEVDLVVKKWWDTLEKVDWEPTLLVNMADINTSNMIALPELNPKLRIKTFSVKDHFIYKEVSVGKIRTVEKIDFEAKIIKNEGLSGTKFKLNHPSGNLDISFHIPGIYHIYDLLAAFGTYYLLNLPLDTIAQTLKSFSPAFGRVEKLMIEGHESFIFLIKNPAGATQVIETIKTEIKPEDQLLIALNDNFADGTDVSWIWDTKFEELAGPSSSFSRRRESRMDAMDPAAGARSQSGMTIICSGKRAEDMALRLKYAGIETKQLLVISDLEKALKKASVGSKGRIFILPTYTALLELQKLLAKMKIKKEYWR